MKKLLSAILVIFVLSINACDFNNDPTVPINIGYTSGGGNSLPFLAFLAISIENPVGSEENPVTLKFEYGHGYNETYYESKEGTYTIVVFISNITGNYNRQYPDYVLLEEQKIDGFVSDEYKCQVNLLIPFSTIEFNKSFDITLSPDDVPYEKGMLYYELYEGDFVVGQEEVFSRINQFVYFTVVDGVLTFTKTNPF